MVKKKKVEEENTEGIVKLERIEDNKNKKYNVSDSFYYVVGLVLGLVLVFATEELLSTINYLFVVVFAIISIMQLINFIMDKEYLTRNYSGLIISIMCAWAAIFIFKYGDFLFLEMLPTIVSLLLFVVATNSFTKYFDRRLKGNLIISIISIVLGILLMFVAKGFMYILLKITGSYMFIMIVLDLIDYKKKNLEK